MVHSEAACHDRRPLFPHCENAAPPGWLVFDCESIPDGKLLNIVKYPAEALTPEAAVARAQAETLDRTAPISCL